LFVEVFDIGNNAGRLKNYVYSADLNSIDKAFCSNIGIKTFFTPEQIFLEDSSIRNWRWDNSILTPKSIKYLQEKQNINDEPNFEDFIPNTNNCIIFITGPPSSGKTLLSKRILDFLLTKYKKEKTSIKILDINNFSNQHLCMSTLKSTLSNKDYDYLCVIDIINNLYVANQYFNILSNFTKSDNFTINKNIDKNNVINDIIYINIDCNIQLCYFLNEFKLQICKSSNIFLNEKFKFSNYLNNKKNITKQNIINKFYKNNGKNINFVYTKFPLVLRPRKELYFYYA